MLASSEFLIENGFSSDQILFDGFFSYSSISWWVEKYFRSELWNDQEMNSRKNDYPYRMTLDVKFGSIFFAIYE